MYDYIERTYGKTFTPGDVVAHTVTHKVGTVMRPKKSHLHYVRVNFALGGAGLCHPDELEKIEPHKSEAPKDT